MRSLTVSWEEKLLRKANISKGHVVQPSLPDDRSAIQWAYDQCRDLTRQHSKTFFLASGLLDRQRRRAARALYAFCRVSDDIIDRGGRDALARLERWREKTLETRRAPGAAVPLAWIDTRAAFAIPEHYAEQLLDGVAQDLSVNRYHTFEELAHYCYGVASTVGLMVMYIIGFKSEAAAVYAIKLGVALQLTNILRDIREDWESGRLYLPLEELAAYGLSEADIAAGSVDERWEAFMQFQIARARRLYKEALPGIAMLDRPGRFAIRAAAELYGAILDDIEAHDYDVFSRRAHLPTSAKLRRLPGIWWRAANTRSRAA